MRTLWILDGKSFIVQNSALCHPWGLGTLLHPSSFVRALCALLVSWAHEHTLKAQSFILRSSQLHHAPSLVSWVYDHTSKAWCFILHSLYLPQAPSLRALLWPEGMHPPSEHSFDPKEWTLLKRTYSTRRNTPSLRELLRPKGKHPPWEHSFDIKEFTLEILTFHPSNLCHASCLDRIPLLSTWAHGKSINTFAFNS